MTQVSLESEKKHETYLANFRERAETLVQREPGWLTEQRQEAIDAFADLGFPTVHDEEWQHTNVAPIIRVPFQAARPGSIHCAVELIETTYWKEPLATTRSYLCSRHDSSS